MTFDVKGWGRRSDTGRDTYTFEERLKT